MNYNKIIIIFNNSISLKYIILIDNIFIKISCHNKKYHVYKGIQELFKIKQVKTKSFT